MRLQSLFNTAVPARAVVNPFGLRRRRNVQHLIIERAPEAHTVLNVDNVDDLVAAVDRASAPGNAVVTGGGATTVGSFVTPQSLVTFPVASGLVTLVWKSLGTLYKPLGTSHATALIVAFVVGAVIYVLTVSDPHLQKSNGGPVVGIAIAVLNCFVLFAAAVGISSVTAAAS